MSFYVLIWNGLINPFDRHHGDVVALRLFAGKSVDVADNLLHEVARTGVRLTLKRLLKSFFVKLFAVDVETATLNRQ